MKPLTIKTGLAIGGIAVGLGLERIPKINKIKAVKRFAKKSKDFGIIEGKRVARSIANEIDPDLADTISYEFSEVINQMINNEEELEGVETEECRPNGKIKVVFIDDEDEEEEIKLLPPHKENA